MEPFQEEVWDPGGDPRAVQAQSRRLKARKAQHLQAARGERRTTQVQC
jgi:hypothetical protein